MTTLSEKTTNLTANRIFPNKLASPPIFILLLFFSFETIKLFDRINLKSLLFLIISLFKIRGSLLFKLKMFFFQNIIKFSLVKKGKSPFFIKNRGRGRTKFEKCAFIEYDKLSRKGVKQSKGEEKISNSHEMPLF